MFEWKTGDDGWDQPADLPEPAVADARQRTSTEPPRQFGISHRRLIIILSLLVVLIAGTYVGLKWRADRNLSAARAEVQGTVDREMRALESRNWGLYRSLLDSRTPAAWQREQQGDFVRYSGHGRFDATVTDVTLLRPELALVEVQIELPDDPTHREARAYRQGQDAWYRTLAPAGNYWLHQVLRETANLRFLYHRDDADRLEPLLTPLQQLYTQLLNDLKLQPLPDRRELQIVFSVQPADSVSTDPNLRYDLSSLPKTANTEQIKRELGRQLTRQVIGQFYQDGGDMAFVLDGIREWEVSNWMGQPDPKSEALITGAVNDLPFLSLSMVQPLIPPARFGRPVTAALAETVIDYLVAHHGRQVARSLIQATRKYDDWSALITGGLQESYPEVDAGWWQSLADRYALARDTSPESVREALEWSLQLEQQALETHNRALFEALLDPEAPSNWRTERLGQFMAGRGAEPAVGPASMLDWRYARDVAWATFEFAEDPGLGLTLVALRFFRLDGGRWYQSSPDTVFAGSALSTTTRYFDFQYYEPDADLIPAVTGDIDALYTQFLQAMDLDSPRAEIRVTFIYDWEPDSPFADDGPNAVTLISPRLFKNPKEFRFILGYTIALKTLTEAVAAAQPPTRETPQLQPSLLTAIALWEAEQWGEFSTWQILKKDEIRRLLEAGTYPSLSGDPASMLGMTIVEYLAGAHGRNYLPDLLKAISEGRPLEDVLPPTTGLDVDAFQADWRSFLIRKYFGPEP